MIYHLLVVVAAARVGLPTTGRVPLAPIEPIPLLGGGTARRVGIGACQAVSSKDAHQRNIKLGGTAGTLCIWYLAMPWMIQTCVHATAAMTSLRTVPIGSCSRGATQSLEIIYKA